MSNLVDSKVLENLLIKEEDNRMDIVEEGMSNGLKALLLGAIMVGGSITIYKDYKKQKEIEKKNKSSGSTRYNKMNYKDILSNYNIDSESSYNSLIKSTLNSIKNDIKKMIQVANKNKELFDSINEKIRNDYGEEEVKKLGLKPGYFKCELDDTENGIEIEIIEHQDVAINCTLIGDIISVLETKSTQDIRYQLFDFDIGDGDEGIIYVTWKEYNKLK